MELLPLFAFFIVGVLAGLLGGLLGLSGGVVTIPSLIFIFHYFDFPRDQVTHMAIGTSLAAMVFNGAMSAWSHHRRQGVVWDLFFSLFPWILLGALAGSFAANFIPDAVLEDTFGAFILLLGIYLIIRKKKQKEFTRPSKGTFVWVGSSVGSVASLLGIGGGVFTVPLLIHFHYPEKKAVGTSAAVSLVITTVAALAYLYFGLDRIKTPETLGYIYLPAFACVGIGAVLAAPVGAKLAHGMDGTLLRRIFAVALLIIGALMIVN